MASQKACVPCRDIREPTPSRPRRAKRRGVIGDKQRRFPSLESFMRDPDGSMQALHYHIASVLFHKVKEGRVTHRAGTAWESPSVVYLCAPVSHTDFTVCKLRGLPRRQLDLTFFLALQDGASGRRWAKGEKV